MGQASWPIGASVRTFLLKKVSNGVGLQGPLFTNEWDPDLLSFCRAFHLYEKGVYPANHDARAWLTETESTN